MRLWTIHPGLLDQKGLGAAWREGLLAQAVIVRLKNGETPGYRNHPQLKRFLSSPAPLLLIGTWLTAIQEEAKSRGYSYNYDKIFAPGKMFKMIATSGQLEFEREHLLNKLKDRSPEYHDRLINVDAYPHPMFEIVDGDPEEWEKTKDF